MKQFIFVILLLIVACGGSTSGTYEGVDIYTGTDGVVIELLDNAPPTQVFENEEFLIAAHLKNKGVAAVDDGIILLRFEEALVDVQQKVQQQGVLSLLRFVNGDSGSAFELSGKTRENPFGGEEYVEFSAMAKPITLTSVETTVLGITTCYNYATTVKEEVCVNPEIRKSDLLKKSCTAEPLSLSSQGAPIAVTLIEPRPVLRQGVRHLQLNIVIEHEGTGYFTLPVSSESLCSSQDIDSNIFNRVQLSGSLGNHALDCQRDGIVRLENNRGNIICTVETSSAGREFMTPVQLEIQYGYTETVSREVEIGRLQ